MTHLLFTRRLATPPVLPQSHQTGAPRSTTGLFRLTHRAPHRVAASATELALARARSETAIDTLLATLPEHWAAFASPALGDDGVHALRLLVGPGGIFALHGQLYDRQAAWARRQAVLALGQRSTDRAVAESGAHRLTALLRGRLPLRTPVQPVFVVLGARPLWVTDATASRRAVSVPVLGQARLAAWLAARPPVLRPIERMELAAVIDNPLTWGMRPSIVPRPGGVGD